MISRGRGLRGCWSNTQRSRILKDDAPFASALLSRRSHPKTHRALISDGYDAKRTSQKRSSSSSEPYVRPGPHYRATSRVPCGPKPAEMRLDVSETELSPAATP